MSSFIFKIPLRDEFISAATSVQNNPNFPTPEPSFPSFPLLQNLKRPPPPTPSAPPTPPASWGGTPLPEPELQERGTPPPEGRVVALEALDSCWVRPGDPPGRVVLWVSALPSGPWARPSLAPQCPFTALFSPPLFPAPFTPHPIPSMPFVHSLKFCLNHSISQLRSMIPCLSSLAPFSARPTHPSKASGVSAEPGDAARGSLTCPLPSSPRARVQQNPAVLLCASWLTIQ